MSAISDRRREHGADPTAEYGQAGSDYLADRGLPAGEWGIALPLETDCAYAMVVIGVRSRSGRPRHAALEIADGR